MAPMNITKQDVASKIISILSLNLDIPQENVRIVSRFKDYNTDSYAMNEAIMEIEKEFNVYFYDEKDLMQVKTIKEISDNVYNTIRR